MIFSKSTGSSWSQSLMNKFDDKAMFDSSKDVGQGGEKILNQKVKMDYFYLVAFD